jgi:hypothetical protein
MTGLECAGMDGLGTGEWEGYAAIRFGKRIDVKKQL